MVGCVLALVACGATEQKSTEAIPAVPTIRVVQVITQVIVTPTPGPATPILPETPTQGVQGGWNPLGVPVYYPLIGCVASRLHVGDAVFVAAGKGEVPMFQGKDIRYDPVLKNPVLGETLFVVDGPWCPYGSIVWKVMDLEKTQGYMAEGNGNEYWLLPYPPNTITPLPTPKPTKITPFPF
jgi:hypothetical protein